MAEELCAGNTHPLQHAGRHWLGIVVVCLVCCLSVLDASKDADLLLAELPILKEVIRTHETFL